MKIVVLNGSPKGELSVTLQYVYFLQKKHPAHQVDIVHVGQRIKRLERDPAVFEEVMAQVRAADLVLWATPVYYFLVPGQLKRFIELVDERAATDAFAGRYAAALTTSIHFYDHTAHAYLAGVSEDWGMRFYGGYSAEMSDLQRSEGRAQLERFADGLLAAVDGGAPTPVRYEPIVRPELAYTPGPPGTAVDQGLAKVLVVMDGAARSTNLSQMVERIAGAFGRPVGVVDLRAVDIAAGCQGCLQCGFDNRCAFEGKDEFIELFRDRVMAADILFYAGEIRDRYLSATWKTYFDRSFFRGHAPSLTGKQLGWIVSGPLRQVPNLGQIIEAYTEMHGANLAGIVTDEYAESAQIDRLLDDLAARSAAWAASGYRSSVSFLGVGGHKLFRDAIWGGLRLVFQADHRTYRARGYYDFPQRQLGVRLMHLMIPVVRIPFVRRRFVPKIKEAMVVPYRRILDGM